MDVYRRVDEGGRILEAHVATDEQGVSSVAECRVGEMQPGSRFVYTSGRTGVWVTTRNVHAGHLVDVVCLDDGDLRQESVTTVVVQICGKAAWLVARTDVLGSTVAYLNPNGHFTPDIDRAMVVTEPVARSLASEHPSHVAVTLADELGWDDDDRTVLRHLRRLLSDDS